MNNIVQWHQLKHFNTLICDMGVGLGGWGSLWVPKVDHFAGQLSLGPSSLPMKAI